MGKEYQQIIRLSINLGMAGSSTDERASKDLVFFGNMGIERFGLDELLSSSAETLGKGTFGYTYKVELEGRDANAYANAMAVKRLKIACISESEFVQRVEELGRLVHENLLPLRAYHCDMNVRRLLYDYMPMGNLSSLLHGSTGKEKTPISWEIRTSIAYGIACGIQYLHSQGPSFCHGNVRSSNVFLTSFHHARLSEFGLAQLAAPKSKTNLIAGYCAPEVKNVHQVSPEADVYSFGVLLLELLTGKAPMNSLSHNEGVDLPKWVRLMFQEKPILDVFDGELLKYQQNNEEQMVQVLELAICCTFQLPNKRPLMVQVTDRIKEICNFWL